MKKIINDKKTKIIETALKLFTEQGLQQTSMAQLSKESSVAVGTMYFYFKSKDELIEAIYMQSKKKLAEAIQPTKKEKRTSIRNQFELIWRKTYKHYLQNPAEFIFANSHNFSPLISNEAKEEGRKGLEYPISVFQEGMDKGIFETNNIVLMLHYVFNSIVTLVQLKLANEIKVTDEMVDKTIEMTWNAYLKT